LRPKPPPPLNSFFSPSSSLFLSRRSRHCRARPGNPIVTLSHHRARTRRTAQLDARNKSGHDECALLLRWLGSFLPPLSPLRPLHSALFAAARIGPFGS